MPSDGGSFVVGVGGRGSNFGGTKVKGRVGLPTAISGRVTPVTARANASPPRLRPAATACGPASAKGRDHAGQPSADRCAELVHVEVRQEKGGHACGSGAQGEL